MDGFILLGNVGRSLNCLFSSCRHLPLHSLSLFTSSLPGVIMNYFCCISVIGSVMSTVSLCDCHRLSLSLSHTHTHTHTVVDIAAGSARKWETNRQLNHRYQNSIGITLVSHNACHHSDTRGTAGL